MNTALWLAIQLPELALATVARAGDTNLPLAVTWKDRIHQANAAAAGAGIRPGQRPGEALALQPELLLKPREPDRETQILEQLAAWGYQFSDQIRLWHPQALVLEIGGSLKLFGDLTRLEHSLQTGLDELGYPHRLATSRSPRAAVLLAGRSGDEPVRALDRPQLWRAIRTLPLGASGLDHNIVCALESSGIHTLGALLKLPRASLHKRFGPELPCWLDELTGQRPDQRPRFQPPRRFASRLELPAAVQDTEALRFPAQRLIQELCGCLRGLDATAQRLRIELDHASQSQQETPQSSGFSLGLASPSQEADRWLGVLRERLERWPLSAPVVAVSLSADELYPVEGQMRDLFGDGDQRNDRARLLERLQQRVRVRQLTTCDDHRPEHSWTQSPAQCGTRSRPTTKPGEPHQPRRPLWLLPEPRPLPALGSDTRLQGPERIESGWWDGEGCRRDYYVATLGNGRCWWIFHEPEQGRWYVHGYFC